SEASSRQETPPSAAKTADNDTERIRLHEEQVDVQKHKKDLGEVQVSKNVVEDTKTVEVPVQREEIHIKKVTPSEGEVDDNAFEEEEFVVPISEEE
ncbi:YsnF/AvaK domain-containing protein, partial [Streptococcus anginosus]